MTARHQRWENLNKWSRTPDITSLTEARAIHQRWIEATGIVPSSLQKKGRAYYAVYREASHRPEIAAAVARYTFYCKKRKTANTRRTDSVRLKRFLEWAESQALYHLHQITAPDILAFIDSLTCGTTTRNHYLTILKAFFRWAADMELLRQNPALRLKELPNYNPRPTVALTREERAKIEEFPEPFRSFCLILLYTGLRANELVHLRWEDLEGGQIVIRPGGEHTPKGTRYRDQFDRIPIHPTVGAVLKSLQAKTPQAVYVFDRGNGRRLYSYSNWYQRIRALRIKHGLKPAAPMHSLRHTFATMLAEIGTPATHLQRLARHRSMATTLRYVHLAGSDLKTSLDRLR
jgi:integrase